jgi:hypothetical protein
VRQPYPTFSEIIGSAAKSSRQFGRLRIIAAGVPKDFGALQNRMEAVARGTARQRLGVRLTVPRFENFLRARRSDRSVHFVYVAIRRIPI